MQRNFAYKLLAQRYAKKGGNSQTNTKPKVKQTKTTQKNYNKQKNYKQNKQKTKIHRKLPTPNAFFRAIWNFI